MIEYEIYDFQLMRTVKKFDHEDEAHEWVKQNQPSHELPRYQVRVIAINDNGFSEEFRMGYNETNNC